MVRSVYRRLGLSRGWLELRDWISQSPPGLRWVVWAACLAAAGIFAVVVGRRGGTWPVTGGAAAIVATVFCAPRQVRGLGPYVLAAIGIAGLVAALTRFGLGLGFPNYVAYFMPNWRGALVAQSAAFVAGGGLWLIVRRRRRRGTTPAAGRAYRWGLLAPLAGAALVLLAEGKSSHPAWLAAAVILAGTAVAAATLRRPAAAAAAAGLVLLGLFGLSAAAASPYVPKVSFSHLVGRGQWTVISGPQAPYSGDHLVRTSTTHLVQVAPSWAAHSSVWILYQSPAGGPLPVVAMAEAAVILAFGLWLAPRVFGPYLLALRSGPIGELAGRAERLAQSRADAVDTAAAELRRVERDLHDGAQARLVALGMSLRAAERLIPVSPDAAVVLVAEAREMSARALTDLRALVRGIYPPVLADRGLADAVRALALDAPVRTESDIDVPGRLEAPVESACYFAIAEALANAVKHAGARLVHIQVRWTPDAARSRPGSPGVLRIEITDNGSGGADPARGTGLAGIERRLGTFDGIMAVSSPPGGPTMIILEVPCALSSLRTSSC